MAVNRIGNAWVSWTRERGEDGYLRITTVADDQWEQALGDVCRMFDVAGRPVPGLPEGLGGLICDLLQDSRKRMKELAQAAPVPGGVGGDDGEGEFSEDESEDGGEGDGGGEGDDGDDGGDGGAGGGEDAGPDDVSAHTWELDGSIFTHGSGGPSDAEESGGSDGEYETASEGGEMDVAFLEADDGGVADEGDVAVLVEQQEAGVLVVPMEDVLGLDAQQAAVGDLVVPMDDVAVLMEEQEAGGDLAEAQQEDVVQDVLAGVEQQRQQQVEMEEQQEAGNGGAGGDAGGEAAVVDAGPVLDEFGLEEDMPEPPQPRRGTRRRAPPERLCDVMNVKKARRDKRY